MTELALQCASVTKRYGSLVALDDVDLAVEPGTVHALLGPNGAGKTTLMRAVLGLLRPDTGRIRVQGQPLSVPGAPRVGGFVEEPRFYPYLSGRRNLELLARLDDAPRAPTVDAVLETVSLTSRAEVRVRGYSYGMRQRLGLAAALLRDPCLLVVDEPSNGLDPAGVRDLRALVRRLSRNGITVLLSSHDMAEVEDLADAVTIMSSGRVVWSGTGARMRDEAPSPVHHLHTSDDARAVGLGLLSRCVEVCVLTDRTIQVQADQQALDRYLLDLAADGVAVRSLQLAQAPLEALFFSLTADADAQAQRQSA